MVHVDDIIVSDVIIIDFVVEIIFVANLIRLKGERPSKTEQLSLSCRKGGSVKTSSKASKSVHQPVQPATVEHHFGTSLVSPTLLS